MFVQVTNKVVIFADVCIRLDFMVVIITAHELNIA